MIEEPHSIMSAKAHEIMFSTEMTTGRAVVLGYQTPDGDEVESDDGEGAPCMMVRAFSLGDYHEFRERNLIPDDDDALEDDAIRQRFLEECSREHVFHITGDGVFANLWSHLTSSLLEDPENLMPMTARFVAGLVELRPDLTVEALRLLARLNPASPSDGPEAA